MSPTKAAVPAPEKVSRREFTARFARRAGVPLATANKVYAAMIEELVELTGKGNSVTLTGFGRFYPQLHKGHSVQFSDGSGGQVEPYAVLKFSATRETNKEMAPGLESLRAAEAAGNK